MPTLGSVPYLNAKPLLEGLEPNPFYAPPVALHEVMMEKKVDIALLPVVSYLHNPELKLISGSGIVSHGPVRSVKLFYARRDVNPENVEKIFLDPHSKTSQLLLKVILREKYGRLLDNITWTNSPEEAEAILQIGDPALLNPSNIPAMDLGQEWSDWTGFPFVYACWMSLDAVDDETLSTLHQAKRRGKAAIPEIARRQEMLEPKLAMEYLTQNIRYDIQGPELVGLKLFFDWVVELEKQDYDTSFRFVA